MNVTTGILDASAVSQKFRAGIEAD